ncbi:hypothetical protein SAMD00019534_035800 [Acytostelium subglobosum LB1]|uniref:hypothetical protein n=1 Tax=Acytostelium subglobosum LB1 TaxID=1410327 RepID=UPI0006447F7A|nr:hypothetical protein SAMD00019534_035800 [Acytostelium subglobosum LB1]GAM20405.1 hypothetical protein SAMD00019534_035800 [Acytostelium subglobosum LB1]|eukprot:XP_012759926.1 hypothetical protein SAMD00019534_035800 [Acytostelium subglobosum LB1]
MVEESMRDLQTKIDKMDEKDQFHNSINVFKEERDKLRTVFDEFYTSPSKSLFLAWWRTTVEDIRRALILTSIEELKEVPEYTNLADSICPELIDFEELIKGRNDNDQLTILFHNLAASRENDSNVFKGQSEITNVYSNTLKDPKFAIDFLLVMRSYLLLSFIVNIILVFETEAEAALSELQ